jgi:hypothetical protein
MLKTAAKPSSPENASTFGSFFGERLQPTTRNPALVSLRADAAPNAPSPRSPMAIAVRGGNMKRRWTKLREWLTNAAAGR